MCSSSLTILRCMEGSKRRTAWRSAVLLMAVLYISLDLLFRNYDVTRLDRNDDVAGPGRGDDVIANGVAITTRRLLPQQGKCQRFINSIACVSSIIWNLTVTCTCVRVTVLHWGDLCALVVKAELPEGGGEGQCGSGPDHTWMYIQSLR